MIVYCILIVKNLDKIILIEEGWIIGLGIYKELLKINFIY